MAKKRNASAESIAATVLAATPPVTATSDHLDENDLTLLEMKALNQPERQIIRNHLQRCDRCRQLASQVLQDVAEKIGLPRGAASAVTE